MSFVSNSRDSMTVNKILKKVKLLLPTLVENSVQSVVKQRVEKELKQVLKPTIKEMIDVIHTDITDNEKPIKAIESQLKNLHSNNSNLKSSLLKKYDALSTKVSKLEEKLKKSGINGTLSSLQLQINNLRKVEMKNVPLELEKVEKDIKLMKRKVAKIQDIKQFQGFLSRQHDTLEKKQFSITKS